MLAAKRLYHRLLPDRIRNPIGMARRRLVDRLARLRSGESIPPSSLLAQVQLTPWVGEYLSVGRRSADAIASIVGQAGISSGSEVRVLDFGCGSGRTIRHFRKTKWALFGTDIDASAIDWCRKHLGFADFRVNDPDPPLPWSDGFFDVVYAVSVFTHLSEERQREWAAELARLVRNDGYLVITTMGAVVMPNFAGHGSSENLQKLEREGFVFLEAAGSFNASAAYHTPAGIVRLFGERFELRRWLELGLDGFQDLALLQRVD